MAKKYQMLRKKIPIPGGGFVESFVLGIAEYSCLGEQHFDLAGYPHGSEIEGLAQDWQALSEDAYSAAAKLKGKIEK
jgi:hypothetical protein